MSRPGRPRFLTSAVTSAAAVAVLAGVAVQPDVLDRLTGTEAVAPANDSSDWSDDTAAEQLRQDQCLMVEVLRLGGPSMAATAQDGLNQPPDKLHALANPEHWEDTPLAVAYQRDRDAAWKELDALNNQLGEWGKPLDGLEQPGGFDSLADWKVPPGSIGSEEDDFHSQTGLTPWIADRFWKQEGDFYEDPTPKADAKTLKAVTDLGTPSTATSPTIPICLLVSGRGSMRNNGPLKGCSTPSTARAPMTPACSCPPAGFPAPPPSRVQRNTGSRSRT